MIDLRLSLASTVYSFGHSVQVCFASFSHNEKQKNKKKSSWGYKVRLALGKTLAADLIDSVCKVSGKSQVLLTLVSRARPPSTPSVVSQRIQRFCCIAKKNCRENSF